MSAQQTAPVRVGATPANMKGQKIEGGDSWKDTPYFGLGLPQDSEHMRAFPEGSSISGILRQLRTTKAEKEVDRKDYACIELIDENGAPLKENGRVRLSLSGQAYYQLEQVGIGNAFTLTYLGKQEVEGYKQKLHQTETVRFTLAQ